MPSAALPEGLGRQRLSDRRSRRRLRFPRDGRTTASRGTGLAPCDRAWRAAAGPAGAGRVAAGRRVRPARGDGGPGRGRHDAAVRRHHLDVEADPAHAPGLRAERQAVRACSRLRRGHGVHGHPAAGPQLQPGLAGDAGHAAGRRHRRAGAVGAGRGHLRRGAARARDAHCRGGAADRRLAGRRHRKALRPRLAEGGAERRRAAAPELRQRLRSLRLHAAGDLRHGRRPDQHDAAGRPRRAAAAQQRRAGATTTRSWCWTTRAACCPTASPANW